MSSASDHPPASWNGLTIAAVAWTGGLGCWLGLLALDSFLFLMRASGTREDKKATSASLLDDPVLQGALYGLSFFAAAYFVGKRSRDRRSPLYVFYGSSLFLALLLLLPAQSGRSASGSGQIILLIPVLAAPFGAWLPSFRFRPQRPPTAESPGR